MMYCEDCGHLVEEERCPNCGNRNLREPKEKDPCFLTEQDYVSSGILEDVLKQEGIPFLRQNVLGAGVAIKVGPMLDRGRFFVAWDQLPKARELAEELFAPAGDAEPEEPEE